MFIHETPPVNDLARGAQRRYRYRYVLFDWDGCLAQTLDDPHEAVMVGDSSKDLIAAANAGVDSILFYPDSHRVFYDLDELKQLNPTHVCRSFAEVRAILLR